MNKLSLSILGIILLGVSSILHAKEVHNYTVRHKVDGKVYVHHYHYVKNGPEFRMEHVRVEKPGHYEHHWHYWVRRK